MSEFIDSVTMKSSRGDSLYPLSYFSCMCAYYGNTSILSLRESPMSHVHHMHERPLNHQSFIKMIDTYISILQNKQRKN